jgi:cytochrome P450
MEKPFLMKLLHHEDGSPNWIHIVIVGIIIFLKARAIGLVLYRLYWSPLRKYPGPKLAAITGYYETYYSIVKGGQWPFEIQRMHEKYGPIVRITPDELHIDDPTFFEVLFYPTDIVDKHPLLTRAGGLPGAVSFATEGELHRPRRMAVAPFFSRSKVIDDYASDKGAMRSVANRLSHTLSTSFAGRREPVNIRRMLASAATDIIWEIVFRQPSHFTEAPEFSHPFPMSFEGALAASHWNSHFPWLMKMLNLIPEWVIYATWPMMRTNLEWRKAITAQVDKIMDPRNKDAYENSAQQTLVHQLTNPKIPEDVRKTERVVIENINIVGASMGAVVWTMTTGMYYILEDPKILKRLQQELREAIPDEKGELPDIRELEKLEYLRACINEALRLAFGGLQRQTRIRNNKTLTYGDHVFGPRTALAMDIWHMNTNPTVFPDPMRFNPDRWLGDTTVYAENGPLVPGGQKPAKDRSLWHYMRAFSAGTRNCFGDHLAMSTITIVLATLFRRHEMHLHHSTYFERDVKIHTDVFLARPKAESKGIFVVFDK